MSGFVGVIHFDTCPVDPELLHALTASMESRGPDATGIEVFGPVGLGHTLLATTHESLNERQPLKHGGLWLVADARIDDRKALIARLKRAGNDTKKYRNG